MSMMSKTMQFDEVNGYEYNMLLKNGSFQN